MAEDSGEIAVPRQPRGAPGVRRLRKLAGLRARQVSINLPADQIDQLRTLGGGNISEGVRRLLEVSPQARCDIAQEA